MRKQTLTFILIILLATTAAAQTQSRFNGSWSGSIDVPGNTLPITVHFEQ